MCSSDHSQYSGVGAAVRGQEIGREAVAGSRRRREQAEQHLDETAEFIVERVVKH